MKIAVLLSGGVDSSVALSRVKEAGFTDVTAFYLKIWLEDDAAFLGECPWEEDLEHARAVCEQLGVPLEVVSLQTEYQDRIVQYVLQELKKGRTPSPDVLCNQQIKFGCFFEKLDSSFDKVVTGHYAGIEEAEGEYYLKRGLDRVKDQTYFLYALSQAQLARLWFPIGHLSKDEVRERARELALPNQSRKDSQGICFLGNIRYSEFVRYHLGEKRGDIVEWESGRRLATHQGVWFYTIGQRRGLGLSGGPWYVVDKDLSENRIYVSHLAYLEERRRFQFVIDPVHWINRAPSVRSVGTKIRHAPEVEAAEIRPLGEGRWEVNLERKDAGIAPGQSAIIYDEETCLGGGVIA